MMRHAARLIVVMLIVAFWGTAPSGKAQTQDQSLEENPVWSPDGSRIAFQSIPYDQFLDELGKKLYEHDYDIWSIQPDGSSATNLTPDSPAYDGTPKWSPDGQSIAFVSNRSGNMDIWVMRADGTNLIDLTATSANPDVGPIWSPDGRYIAYSAVTVVGMSYEVWIVSPDGSSDPIPIATEPNHLYGSTTWLPDSSSIAFTDAIMVLDFATDTIGQYTPNGIQVVQLGDHVQSSNFLAGVNVIHLAWSPTNSTLFTYATSIWDGHLWLADTSQTASRQVSTLPGATPIWSSNGTKIAFVSPQGSDYSSFDIWTFDTTNLLLMNLTTDLDIRCILPSWSPDGKQIVFTWYS